MSTTTPIVFVTGNAGKFATACEHLASVGVELEQVTIDLDEIQSSSVEEVALHKAQHAFRILGRPVIVEDSGFCIDELNDFPGPLVKFVIKALGAEGIARLADQTATRRCHFQGVLVYIDAHGVPRVFADEGDGGTIAEMPTAKPQPGSWSALWDVFVPTGCTEPLSALRDIERAHVFDRWAKQSVFTQFGEWLVRIGLGVPQNPPLQFRGTWLEGGEVMNSINFGAEHEVLAAAKEDQESVVELTRELIRLPSRGGVDSYEPVLERLRAWLSQRHLAATVLKDGTGAIVGLTCEVRGARPGARWVLDACLGTAPFGDEKAWTHSPTSGVIDDGWLWGRGSSDSKVGAAIFCHIAARLAAMTDDLSGSLVLLFDVDEHTGGFGGAKRYFEGPDAPDDVAGVMIGYPGMDKLVVGGRGVHRAKLHVHGVASHSGGSKSTPSAIEKAAQLIRVLSTAVLPDGADAEFPLPGKLTVTAVEGGQGYSVTPDLCTLNVDIRTTPVFDGQAASRLLHDLVAQVDHAWPATRPTLIQVDTRWPAYVLPGDSRLRTAVVDAARTVGVEVAAKVAGPSNIGNYLAGLSIPATAGFGVTYLGLHGTDERIRIDTIPTVQAVYHATVRTLLGA